MRSNYFGLFVQIFDMLLHVSIYSKNGTGYMANKKYQK